jgi:hypothetical protein
MDTFCDKMSVDDPGMGSCGYYKADNKGTRRLNDDCFILDFVKRTFYNRY